VEREVFSGSSTEIEAALRPHVDRLILDVDDGVFLDQPEKFARLAELADTVVCGNQMIADHFQPLSRAVVTIPTVIDTTRYPVKEKFGEPCVLGWTGSSSNLPYLLRLTPILGSLAAARNIRLHVVADRSEGLEELESAGVDVRFTRWNPHRETADLADFQIGLMPLADEPWARLKCGLKIIQYFGLGIPAVASPVGANVRIIRDGENGLLASTDDDWTRVLMSLMDDPEFRQKVDRAGRVTAEERYSVSAHVDRWWDVLRGEEPSR